MSPVDSNSNKSSSNNFYSIWLLLIIITGCLLRCYHLFSIPYTYDELSALNRTHFNTFHDLIAYGVIPDGHPAGVQIFLYYWTKLFGAREWIVKLPFIIMGILCIPLIYNIGKEWFNKPSALVAASLMACLQYPVMYSQIARPYISGLFLVLLLVVILNRLTRNASLLSLLAFTVVLALCAYTHYFCLLTAGCITITGFFLVSRKDLLKYSLSVSAAMVLFLPHLPIFFSQLSLGGLEWLTPPDKYFFTNYLFYIFNFSPYIIVLLLLFIVAGAVTSKTDNSNFISYRIISLLWFLVPLIIGYLYSVYRAPVLQNSVLIFGFPFLILFISSFTSVLPALRNVQMAVLIVVLCSSLIFERNYYSIFYNAETETFAKEIIKWEQQLGTDKVAAVAKTNPNYLNFYKQKYNYNFNYATFDSFPEHRQWREWLNNLHTDYLVLCNPPQEWDRQYLAIAKEYYPYLANSYSGFTTDIFILKKDSTHTQAWPQPFFAGKFADASGFWIKDNIHEVVVDSEKTEMFLDSSIYKPVFNAPLKAICPNDKYKIDIAVDIWSDTTMLNGMLLLDFLNSKQETLQERQSSFLGSGTTGPGWHRIYLTARMYHTPFNSIENVELSFTTDEKKLKFRNLELNVEKDNPLLYSLIRK